MLSVWGNRLRVVMNMHMYMFEPHLASGVTLSVRLIMYYGNSLCVHLLNAYHQMF